MNKILVSAIAASICLYGQEVHKLDNTVITATKTQNSIKDLTTSVQIIGSEEIENSGSNNLSDILNNNGAIYISPSGKTYRIRGMEHSDTLILIDGKRVNGEFSKTFELERISAGMIERIEILKGTSSLLYGSDAMGGVINIITKKSTKDTLSGNIQIVTGEDKIAGDIFVSQKKGDTSYSLYANYLNKNSYEEDKTAKIKIMQSGTAKSPSSLNPSNGKFTALQSNLADSYTIANDYIYNIDIKNIGGKISHEISDTLDLYFDFSYLKEEKDGEYISSSYPTGHSSNSGSIMAKNVPAHQYNENDRLALGAGLNYAISNEMDIRYDISYSKYEKDRKTLTSLFSELGYSSLEDSAFSVNKSTLKHLDNSLQFTHTINGSNRYILGAEYRKNDTESTAFKVDNRTYSSLFAQHEYKLLDELKMVYGLRYDKTSENESEVSFSLGGVYALNDNISLKANYAEGFRSADDRELYVNQTTPTGKKKLGATVIDTASGKTTAYELKSETSDTVELGILANLESIDIELSLYQTDVKDRISEKSYGVYSTFENIANSKIKGAEASISFSPFEDLITKMNIAYTDAKNKDTNANLTEIPKHLAGLTLSYFPMNDLELRSITKYVGSQYLDTNQKIGGYSITNLKVNASEVFKNTDLFAGVDNIFDKKTNEDIGVIPQSYLYAGVKYKF